MDKIRLTIKQNEVFKYIKEGYSIARIANKLGRQNQTILMHAKRLESYGLVYRYGVNYKVTEGVSDDCYYVSNLQNTSPLKNIYAKTGSKVNKRCSTQSGRVINSVTPLSVEPITIVDGHIQGGFMPRY